MFIESGIVSSARWQQYATQKQKEKNSIFLNETPIAMPFFASNNRWSSEASSSASLDYKNNRKNNRERVSAHPAAANLFHERSRPGVPRVELAEVDRADIEHNQVGPTTPP